MLECWRQLESCRPPGHFAAGAIPWDKAVQWARMHGAGRREALVIAGAIRIADIDRADRISSELEAKRR